MRREDQEEHHTHHKQGYRLRNKKESAKELEMHAEETLTAINQQIKQPVQQSVHTCINASLHA